LLTRLGEIKLIDFGLCNFYDAHDLLSTFCGSLYFASPELLEARPYRGPEVDIWSFGVILYVLVCAKVPFDAPSLPELHAKIRGGKVTFPPHMSPTLVHLLQAILVTDPKKRFTIDMIQKHPWMRGGCSSFIPNRAARFEVIKSIWTSQNHSISTYKDAMVLLGQITKLPETKLRLYILDRRHHLHSMYLLVVEWIERVSGELCKAPLLRHASVDSTKDSALGASPESTLLLPPALSSNEDLDASASKEETLKLTCPTWVRFLKKNFSECARRSPFETPL
jgi:serine/threonine protein kinase